MMSAKNWSIVWSEMKSRYFSPDILGKGGVTVYKPEKCYNGYTLFCRNRGSLFYLIDMEGNVVHTWKPEIQRGTGIMPPLWKVFSRIHRKVPQEIAIQKFISSINQTSYLKGSHLFNCKPRPVNENRYKKLARQLRYPLAGTLYLH